MAVSLPFLIYAVLFWDTSLLELRWVLVPGSDSNWISAGKSTSPSSFSSYSPPFHYAAIIVTIFWLLQHTLYAKICYSFETLHLCFLQLDICIQFDDSVTWRISRAGISASNVARLYGCQFGRGTYFLATRASPQHYLSMFKTWRLASPKVSHPGEREPHRSYAVHNLAFEVTASLPLYYFKFDSLRPSHTKGEEN